MLKLTCHSLPYAQAGYIHARMQSLGDDRTLEVGPVLHQDAGYIDSVVQRAHHPSVIYD